MTNYAIARDTPDWDVPLNANLVDIDSRLTTGESTNATQNANISTNTTNITTLQGQMTAVTTTANNAVPKDSQVVNVKDHGAVGNGSTDDTSAINASVTALGGNGGVVYFPPGTYLLNGSSSITLPGNTSLVGAGPEASAIVIGASSTAGAAVDVTGDFARVQDIEIRGASSAVSSNPTAFGVQSVNNQQLRINNVYFKWINNYAVKAWGDTVDTSTNGTTLHGGSIVNSSIVSCAGGVWARTTNGGAASGVWPANFQIIGLFTRFLGLNAGASANLDGVRIEDCGDVLLQNVFTWMNATSGGTGAALRIVGNCAAIFIQNLDALGPQTGSANVQIESNGNGDPQNVQINGGVIQQGGVGILVAGASNQVRVRGVRILNNQTHGVSVTSTGFGIYFDECLLSINGAGATGTNYDFNWSGTATGFITDCRIGSNIVAVNSAGVQFSINVAAGQNVRVLNADFSGSGSSSANWFTNFPQTASRMDGTRFEMIGDMDFRYTSSTGRLSLQPTASTNRALATNVNGADANDRFRLLANGNQEFGIGSSARDTTWGRQGVAQIGTPDSDIATTLAGKGFMVKEGTNAKMGTTTLNSGTNVTVNTTAVTANSRIFLTTQAVAGATPGTPVVVSRIAGTSFTIKSTGSADTSTVAWLIIEPS